MIKFFKDEVPNFSYTVSLYLPNYFIECLTTSGGPLPYPAELLLQSDILFAKFCSLQAPNEVLGASATICNSSRLHARGNDKYVY